MSGLRLAVSWLTVFPVPGPSSVDRRVAGRAISLTPVVGVALGALAAALAWGVVTLGAPPLLAGLLTVGLLALLTRGMHLDGLADTADGLGCYGPPARALEIMKSGGAGPFAVVVLVVGLGIQAACLGVEPWPAVVLAVVFGRVAFAWCCLRSVPAARPEGLGALVAGTQPLLVPLLWTVAAVVAGFLAVPGKPWLGPIGVVVATGLVLLLLRHVGKRFGGITGDVLGAACELATTVVLVVCAF
ncbi:adenosylcobinamide-GDP ribazoletransferase [Kutzneria sp. 744]|uniref:adenosylcobinamide-GDP ribazoletransferase n=1 Tax=Kutzneria sp. (strain 744) TaxID=345341 RepID=UPI0003EED853|nr:adenosylcobinamide-GDP ribazoletransferase [Kutzneria sp. 744]EWM12764.1 adenosylcobinamide-GDP ribazoletransferase [Kutzneria sp. 744]